MSLLAWRLGFGQRLGPLQVSEWVTRQYARQAYPRYRILFFGSDEISIFSLKHLVDNLMGHHEKRLVDHIEVRQTLASPRNVHGAC